MESMLGKGMAGREKEVRRRKGTGSYRYEKV